MSEDKSILGATGSFNTPDESLSAAKEARKSVYEYFDMLTPFPVQGMDEAMGLGRSRVPWFTLLGGMVGIMVTQVMMVGIMVYMWPLNFGGKPNWFWSSLIPINFEMMMLFAGVATVAAAVIAWRKFNVPQPPSMLNTGATSDGFILWISAQDRNFEADKVVEFIKGLNANDVRLVYREGPNAKG